jgi:hypothetical protein
MLFHPKPKHQLIKGMTTETVEKVLKQLESFVNSDNFRKFFMLYYQKTQTPLNTFEQLVDAISEKIVTPRDLFEESLNKSEFGEGFSEDQEDFWLDNLDLFDYDCYYPLVEKQVQNGSCWIKVKTETGFQIHLARKATRKLNLNMLSITASNKYIKELSKQDFTELGKKKLSKTQQETLKKQVYAVIGLQPYELWYWRTKSQKAYVTTNEYEIIDIKEWIDYIQDKSLKGVLTVRSLFTSKNKDKIFYLQSRGISAELAKIYANLDQCYFDVNMVKGMDIINEEMRNAFSSQLSL